MPSPGFRPGEGFEFLFVFGGYGAPVFERWHFLAGLVDVGFEGLGGSFGGFGVGLLHGVFVRGATGKGPAKACSEWHCEVVGGDVESACSRE